MSGLTLFAAPGVEPLTLEETKSSIKVDTTEDDALIVRLIIAARTTAEAKTNRALVTQTWDLTLDRFPGWELHLPKPKLQSVTSITYIDTNGVERTLAPDQYLVDATTEPARITPAYGLVWPVTRYQTNAVKVRFVAGYGLAAAVPPGIKIWMLVRIRQMYDNRVATEDIRRIAEFPRAFVDGLLDDFAVHDFSWARS